MPPEEKKQRDRESRRRSYLKNAEKRRAEASAYQKAHPEKVREWARAARARKSREELRTMDQSWRYGLPPGGFEQWLTEQDYCCYLCREPLDLEKKRGIHIDHDHSCCRGNRSCGKCIRGLACHACNTGIGAFGDDPERMIQVAGRLAAANAEVAARRAAAPVQAQLFDINAAAGRHKKEVS